MFLDIVLREMMGTETLISILSRLVVKGRSTHSERLRGVGQEAAANPICSGNTLAQ